MSTDLTNVRAVALSLPGVEEGVCHGTPAFYVRRKLLARLQDDGETLAIGCARQEREELIEKHPDVFSVPDHFRGYDYILMNLTAANQQLLLRMFESAWRRRAGRKAVAKFESSSNRSSQPSPPHSG